MIGSDVKQPTNLQTSQDPGSSHAARVHHFLTTMKEKQTAASLAKLVGINVEGWEALQSIKDGTWLGNTEGVICYGDHELARMALTIVWQREGDARYPQYKIAKFTGAPVKGETFTPKLSAEEALKRYEKRAR